MKRTISGILCGIVTCGLVCFAALSEVEATRIKDLADIQGVRSNQLVGYGLVVGLQGTGDDKKLLFTIRSLVNMLERMGVTVNPRDAEVENVAAVMVTADLLPFVKAGNRMDVLVSSIGDAETLQGGTLLLTPLLGSDGEVYAVAQGPVSIGGGVSAGGSAAKVQKNFPTVGRVVGGALIEKEIPLDFNGKTSISVTLHNPDFTTASRVAEVINGALNDQFARTPDAGTVEVAVPEDFSGKVVSLVTMLEGLDVIPDTESKVMVNERTGTVVMGESVRISTVAVSHGNLSIEIKESPSVSQPLPFSTGDTVVVPETEITMQEERSPLFLVEAGVNIGEVVRALNALGVSPRDLIAILQAIKSAGALQAKLEIM